MIARTCLVAALLSAHTATLAAQHPISAIVDRWLFCIECENGQLDSVREAAVRAPDSTVAYAAERLLRGATSRQVAWQRRYLSALYALDSANARRDSLASVARSRSQSVSHFLGTFDTSVRRRAAIALGTIGGAPAFQALDSALAMRLAPGVEATVRFARDSLWRP